MKIRNLLSSMMVMVALVMVVTGASAQNGPAKSQQRRQEIAKHLAQKLNLTDQQKEQIKSLREQFRTTNAGTLAEIKALREKMREAIKNKDKDAAKAVRDELKAKMSTLKPAAEQLRQSIGQILTPEQRQMMEKIRAERKEKREERRGKWREHHGKQGGTQQGGSEDFK